MTRPMPEPPECTCMSRGNFCWTCVDTIGYDPEEECPSCPVHAVPTKRLTTYRKCSEPKRLTDAECAAHRWQAASTLGLALYAPAEVLGVDIPEDGNMYSWERPDAEPLNRAYDAWHRFATHPHALEES